MHATHVKSCSADQNPDLMRDESRSVGHAESVFFPTSESEIIHVLRNTEGSITSQGARTGITGGSVPSGGNVINLSQMRQIRPVKAGLIHKHGVCVQAGVTLSDLRAHLCSTGFFFPPDPTEASASIGGMISCNASGARSYKYGSIRGHVSRIKAVLASGEILDIPRGQYFADGLSFCINSGSSCIQGKLPSYKLPTVKNSSGYYVLPDMDLIDLFIGSEGTLAIVVEADLAIIKTPAFTWGITVFLADTESAVGFVADCRRLSSALVAAIEFFDRNAISLLREQKLTNPSFSYIPNLKMSHCTAVYIELEGDNESELDDLVCSLSAILHNHGGDDSDTWLASESGEIDRMKKFRHALPEAVNLQIDIYRKKDPSITKLGTDFAVPDECLSAVMKMYETDLARTSLKHVIFGHIGSNHLHVNILPSSKNEYDKGKALYLEWARAIIQMGGTVSAEHGIGKLKTSLLNEMYQPDGVQQMKELKMLFDPHCRLNPGNLFTANE